MKGFLILLAISLTASEKLDRTYLPPPGAKLSGGSPGAIQVPLDPPKKAYPTGKFINDNASPADEIAINRLPPGFAQATTKSPITYYTEKLPSTTTSYAFSQTTTLPPIETFGTTAGPINPITGAPVQYSTPGNLGFSSIPTFQTNPNYAQNQFRNIPPAFINNQPIVNEQVSYVQPNGQLLGQYQDQYSTTVIPGSNIQANGPIPEFQIQRDQYYPNAQQEFTQSTDAPQTNTAYSQGASNFQPGSAYNPNFGPTVSPILQSNFPGQQIQNLQPQAFPQNQYQQGILSQEYPENQDTSSSTSSSTPEYYNQPAFSSTTPLPAVSSTVIPTSGRLRTERPQTDGDRNAVILNFENVRTPNGYSYSYDTSNGIHADESGIIDNGTKAKGSFSYVGDDGKVYSITYTADENGFLPRGDHLPTAPPIPEAIQRVIDQAARDKDAGIIDDGSYDEAKYGDKKYQGKLNGYNLPNKSSLGAYYNNNDGTSRLNSPNPISGISDIASSDENRDSGLKLFKNGNLIDNNKEEPFIKTSAVNGNANVVNEITQYGNPVGIEPPISPSFGSKIQGPNVNRPNLNTNQYPGSQGDYGYTDTNNNGPFSIDNVQNQDVGNNPKLFNRPSEDSTLGFGPQNVGENKLSKGSQSSNNLNDAQDGIPEPSFIENKVYKVYGSRPNDSPTNNYSGNTDFNKPVSNVETAGVNRGDQHVDDGSGYNYKRPETKFGVDSFPTRIKGQESSTTAQPEQYRKSTEITTLKPFMTPNVYSERTGSTFTRRPFITIATSPTTESSFVDLIDANDYPTNVQGGQVPSSIRGPGERTSSSEQPGIFQQSRKPNQYTSGQQTRVNQKPDSRSDYTIISSSPMPPQSSRFGVTPTTQSPMQITSRFPSTIAPGSNDRNRFVSTQAPSSPKFNSQPNVPGYSSSNLAPGSSAPSIRFGSRIPSANATPQRYSTTTYRPYSPTTINPESNLGSAPIRPQTTYDFGSSGPISSYGSNKATSRPGFVLSGPGMYSQVPPGSVYQPGYQYGPIDYSQTSRPLASGIVSANQTPGFTQSPVNYQAGSQYRPTSGFSTTSAPISQAPERYSTVSYNSDFLTQKPRVIVDNFGRPINSDGARSTGYQSSNNSRLPSNEEELRGQSPSTPISGNVQGRQDSTGKPYSGYGNKVIGEDFSGPKQQQKFDPQTGYHY